MLNRRDLMQTVGVATFAATSSSAFAATKGPTAPPAPFDPKNPEHNLIAFAKIIASLDGAPVWSWSHGRVFGILKENELAMPLMDYVSGQLNQVRRLKDGSYQRGYRGLIMFTNLDSDRVIDEWKNPITGETNKVVHFKTSGGSSVYTANGPYSLGGINAKAPALDDKPFVMPWTFVGDDAWCTYDERVDYIRPVDGAHRVDNAVNRYHVKLSQLLDPKQPNCEANSSWSTEINWFTWMNMGARPGHIMWSGMGKRYRTVAEYPKSTLEQGEKRFPGFLTKTIDWSEFKLRDPALAPT
jgi:Protein of unknown function (DUF1838)